MSPSSDRVAERLRWGARTYVMGILNVTPDSFSGDGVGGDLGAALARAEVAVADGADILDVGGESTRPGAHPVDEAEEARRVLPVIRALADRTDVPISIDTSKAGVAERALDAGACMVNDVWGLRRDPRMAHVVARAGAWVVLMHNRLAVPEVGEIGGYYPRAHYADVLEDVAAELARNVERAWGAGIRPERILVDPGLGFGKTPAQSRELVRRLAELRARLPCPLLVGPSRKSFVGLVTGAPPEERSAETLAAVALCVAGGADVVRVHDVAAAVRACRVADAIVRVPSPAEVE